MARAFAAVLLLTGAIQLSAGWSDVRAAAVLATGALLPYASMLLALRLRVPRPAVVVAWLAVVAVAGLVVAGGSLGGWLAVLRDGVPRLLTAPRPAPTTPELLVPGALFAILVGLWVGARSTLPRGGLFAALVGSSALYLGGALLSAGRADEHGIIAVLLVLSGAAGWALTERRSSRGAQRLTVVLSGTAVSAAVAALVASILIPAGEAFEPRALVSPPLQPLVERNPLPRLAALASDERVLFRHTAGDRRLHLVALTAFDGSTWESAAVYRPIGVIGPETLPPGRSRTSIDVDIAVEGLDGPWLPASGVPEAVSIDGARVDGASGSLIVAGGARPGLRYEVRGLVETPDEADLAVARVPPAPAYLEVPRLPFTFTDFVQRTVQGAGTPFEQAVLIEAAVRQGRQIDARAPAGSSYARLETFLFGQRGEPGAQAGTSEQFATAFAVLARAVGLPTRVVFGFGPGQAQPDGSRLVRGRDALAWPEVYFSGQGWIPFDPSPAPPDSTGPSAGAKRQVLERVAPNQPEPRPTSATSPRPARVAPPTSAPPVQAGPPPPSGPGRDLLRIVRLVVLALLLAIVALLASRGLRRLRHRRYGARGAWSEVLDLLVLADRRPATWHTAVRIARDVAAAYPASQPHPITRLAQWADRATFAPRGAAGGRATSESATVDSPWSEVRRLRRAVRQRTPWHRRLRWALDPRPLWRR